MAQKDFVLKENRLSVVGCSVGLRIRPPAKDRAANQVYADILKDLLEQKAQRWKIFNNCKSRLLTSELIDCKDHIACQNPDVVVLNVGAVDAPNREIPKWFSDIIFRRKWRFLYGTVLFLYNNLIKRFLRKILVFLRLKTTWVSPKRFRKHLAGYIDFIQKDLNSEILILGINPGNYRIEKQLPGSLSRYREYNGILKDVSKQYGCSYISMADLSSEKYFPDGVHFNEKGHKLCAERIYRVLENIGLLSMPSFDQLIQYAYLDRIYEEMIHE